MVKIITSIILIIASLYIIFGYVKPTYNTTDAILKAGSQYDKALHKARQIQERKRLLLEQYNNLFAGQDLSKLEKMLPSTADNVRLILDIDGIAASRGIRIGSVKIQKSADARNSAQTGAVGFATAEQSAQPYKSMVVEFTTVTTYENFKHFLQDLERSLRIVDLVSLKVSPAYRQKSTTTGQDNDEPAIYKFRVGIKTYWLK